MPAGSCEASDGVGSSPRARPFVDREPTTRWVAPGRTRGTCPGHTPLADALHPACHRQPGVRGRGRRVPMLSQGRVADLQAPAKAVAGAWGCNTNRTCANRRATAASHWDEPLGWASFVQVMTKNCIVRQAQGWWIFLRRMNEKAHHA